MSDHDLTLDPWQVDPAAFPEDGSARDRIRFLLRFAILAPSSHNSQPWAFRVRDGAVDVELDESRWLRVADPDRRELHLSVGCAVENLVVAARRFGFEPRVRVDPAPDGPGAARIELDRSGPAGSQEGRPLFQAILRRRTSHEAFTDRHLEDGLVRRLHRHAADAGARLVALRDAATRKPVAELQREADERQMEDREYREELGEWIGSGALGDSWPRARIAQWVVSHFDLGEREGQDNAQHIARAPLVGVLVTADDGTASRIRAGRAYQRIALAATVEEVATHPLSQTLEIPELRERLSRLLDLGAAVPQHLFRAGHAEAGAGHTPRWPLERFLLE